MPAHPDQFSFLPSQAVQLHGRLQHPLENSLAHWNKGVVPYAGFVQMFRTGRGLFAQGEMWGKAVRSGCLFYRHTRDPELKAILRATVLDLLTTRRANGSISCSPVEQQPDGPGGELWERKYIMLGLEEYYEQVEADPAVLRALVDEADVTLAQIGPSPKVRIVSQGWSPNHIESSTLLEPMMRLHRLTGDPRYLVFARYIVEEGGAQGYNLFDQALANTDPARMGGPYPKAYEMMSLFEGLVEYYRATGDERWKTAALNLYRNIREKEITLIGNGGGDEPHHPAVLGEAWDYTATEQTNPAIKRMMETCAGVTWLKFCSQLLRLTGDPGMVDAIEQYAYNGLIGAMKPEGDGFSYVNLLNGVKTNIVGWGARIDGVDVTCCNLNGPMGLAYLPLVAAMQSMQGPVINLFNPMTVKAATPGGQAIQLEVIGDYPLAGAVKMTVALPRPEKFTLRVRIPAWSERTQLQVNGQAETVTPGAYATLTREWRAGDAVALDFDLRARVVDAPRGSDRAGDNFQAVIRGPLVLARDENIDSHYNQPVRLAATAGRIEVQSVNPTRPGTSCQFTVPTSAGDIAMVDYASVDSWHGKCVCTWLPKLVP